MRNITTNIGILKRTIFTLCKKISDGTKRPFQKFTADVCFGVLSSNSCVISDIAQALQEDTQKINTIERLARNLSNGIPEKAQDNYLNTANDDQTYTAQFNQTTRQYTITVTSAGHGTVTGGGTYDYGTSVPLTATPDTYYTFSSWTDAGAQNHNVTVTGTATYTASFTLNTSSTLEINDNENTTYYSTILAAYNGTPMDIQLNRTFYAGMWNTVCFPFDLTAVQRSSSGMSAATFYTLSSVTGDAAEGLDFNVTAITTETMTARTPYLVQFTGADIVNPVFEDVTLAASAFTNNTSGTNVGETSFFGTVHPTSLEIGENSGYLFLGQNNSLYWPNVNNDIRAFRAYFYSGNSTVQAVRPRARIVVKEQTATGNSGISGNSGTSGESARKYLHNGVLVIERDGVKYNAVGQPIE